MIENKKVNKKNIIILMVSLLFIITSTMLFLELAEDVWEEEQFYIDEVASELLKVDEIHPLYAVITWVTTLGSVPLLVSATIILSLYLMFSSKHTKWEVTFLLINMIGISTLTSILKRIIHRDRPGIFGQYEDWSYSFPSGHTTGAIAFYGFCAYVVWRSGKKQKSRILISLCLLLLAVVIAFSRIMLGVHYFTDILAGATIASSWLLICLIMMEWLTWRKNMKGHFYTSK